MEYGLIGEKLGHSFSKIIHEKLTDYTYDLTPLDKEEFKSFMERRPFRAINVTIPYKVDVIPYLNEIDEHAKNIGAVNTIVNRSGKLSGYNTDFSGFLYLINHNNIQIQGKKVLVLGKGGASKAIIAVMKYLKAKEIIMVYYKESPNTVTYEECEMLHSNAEIIINTTPVGMFPNIGECPINLTKYKRCEAVIDVIYNPLKPMLIVQAENLGIKALGGLEMLVAQAKYAVEIFLNKKIEDATIDTIYKDLLLERSNLVLIGMPSCGKTTIGKELSALLKKRFLDMDEEIIKKIGMPIADYFANCGEEAFRAIETEVTKELSGENGLIISTGGGCVKDKINMDYLKLNGKILFVQRDTNVLSADESRPLSKSPEILKKMYAERLPLYQAYAEKTVDNNGTLEDTLVLAKKAYYEMI